MKKEIPFNILTATCKKWAAGNDQSIEFTGTQINVITEAMEAYANQFAKPVEMVGVEKEAKERYAEIKNRGMGDTEISHFDLYQKMCAAYVAGATFALSLASREGVEWISVEQAQPKEYETGLWLFDGCSCFSGYYIKEGKFYGYLYKKEVMPTHWMRLPEPPQLHPHPNK